MQSQPIGPAAHGVIDYAFVSTQALAPTLLVLHGAARTLRYGFAAFQGVVNALTDTPVGVRPRIPFQIHGRLETPFVPALLLLPWLTGALRQRTARRYFTAFFCLAAANYLLTDYRAQERAGTDGHERPQPTR